MYVLTFFCLDFDKILLIENHARFALSTKLFIPWVKVPEAEIVNPRYVYCVTFFRRVLFTKIRTNFNFFQIC